MAPRISAFPGSESPASDFASYTAIYYLCDRIMEKLKVKIDWFDQQIGNIGMGDPNLLILDQLRQTTQEIYNLYNQRKTRAGSVAEFKLAEFEQRTSHLWSRNHVNIEFFRGVSALSASLMSLLNPVFRGAFTMGNSDLNATRAIGSILRGFSVPFQSGSEGNEESAAAAQHQEAMQVNEGEIRQREEQLRQLLHEHEALLNGLAQQNDTEEVLLVAQQLPRLLNPPALSPNPQQPAQNPQHNQAAQNPQHNQD